MPSTSRSHGNKTAPGSSILLSKDEVIELLLEVARKAYYALEDSEERGEGSLVPSENAMELQAALDALEGLPAAPGYVSCGPNNAKYALRSFEAQAADAEREVAEVWDKKVTPRSESEPSKGSKCASLGHVWVGIGDEGRVVCDECEIDKTSFEAGKKVPTPRTDAEEFRAGDPDEQVVPVDFARQLEQELHWAAVRIAELARESAK